VVAEEINLDSLSAEEFNNNPENNNMIQ